MRARESVAWCITCLLFLFCGWLSWQRCGQGLTKIKEKDKNKNNRGFARARTARTMYGLLGSWYGLLVYRVLAPGRYPNPEGKEPRTELGEDNIKRITKSFKINPPGTYPRPSLLPLHLPWRCHQVVAGLLLCDRIPPNGTLLLEASNP